MRGRGGYSQDKNTCTGTLAETWEGDLYVRGGVFAMVHDVNAPLHCHMYTSNLVDGNCGSYLAMLRYSLCVIEEFCIIMHNESSRLIIDAQIRNHHC